MQLNEILKTICPKALGVDRVLVAGALNGPEKSFELILEHTYIRAFNQ